MGAEDGSGVEGGSATSSGAGTQIVRHAEPLRWSEATWTRSHRECAKGGGSLDRGERSGDLQLSLSERVAQVRSPDERASVAGGCAPLDLAHMLRIRWAWKARACNCCAVESSRRRAVTCGAGERHVRGVKRADERHEAGQGARRFGSSMSERAPTWG